MFVLIKVVKWACFCLYILWCLIVILKSECFLWFIYIVEWLCDISWCFFNRTFDKQTRLLFLMGSAENSFNFNTWIRQLFYIWEFLHEDDLLVALYWSSCDDFFLKWIHVRATHVKNTFILLNTFLKILFLFVKLFIIDIKVVFCSFEVYWFLLGSVSYAKVK